jgi:aerotaxis receptor
MEQINGTVRNTAAGRRGTRPGRAGETAAHASSRGGAGAGHTMAAISESSRRIGDIIQVIEGVAFQTNILALNAAVADEVGDEAAVSGRSRAVRAACRSGR